MTKTMWKRILCVGLACWMIAVIAFVPQPHATEGDTCDYEVAAPQYGTDPDGNED